ncbi:MAG: ATP-binding protein [Candidatus Thermoplasmatota archaeon]|nr:ATP-binding protein [Candidatus Thermoplasmatota archaeon]
MRIAVASGKGGTGKTTVATNLALSIGEVLLLDCDVEEPDSHIFLGLDMGFVGNVCIPVPRIDKEKCTLCKKCSEFCQYHAIAVLPKNILFFPELCHGCGGCNIICPENAITEENRIIGIIEGGKKDDLEFYQGLLNIGEPMATPVISRLKRQPSERENVVLDSPPGTSCPVIETITDSDYCILVTEPTPFGLHDLKLAVDVVRTLEVPFGVVINRAGSGDDEVEKYCQKEGIPLLMKIPQSMDIARLYSKGVPFVIEMPEWKDSFRELFARIKREVEE